VRSNTAQRVLQGEERNSDEDALTVANTEKKFSFGAPIEKLIRQD
jgi:hypothetical protein